MKCSIMYNTKYTHNVFMCMMYGGDKVYIILTQGKLILLLLMIASVCAGSLKKEREMIFV